MIGIDGPGMAIAVFAVATGLARAIVNTFGRRRLLGTSGMEQSDRVAADCPISQAVVPVILPLRRRHKYRASCGRAASHARPRVLLLAAARRA
jgi:hypothetical protein